MCWLNYWQKSDYFIHVLVVWCIWVFFFFHKHFVCLRNATMQRQLERLNSLYPSCPTCRLLAPRWPITRPLPSSSRTSPVCSSFSQFCLLVLACYVVKAGITPCNIWPDFAATEKAWKVYWSLHPTPLFQPPKYFLITWQWSRSLWPEWIQTRYSGSLCRQVTLSQLQNCYLVLQTKIHTT